MKTYTFDSKLRLGTTIPSFTDDQIKNEPMFFSCDRNYVESNGGPISKSFLAALESGWENCIIDSRVHMLMPGWWPAIAGNHHDDVPRSKSNGQPNYDNPEYYSEHAMALVGGDVCPTEFSLGKAEFEEVVTGKVYGVWHNKVNEYVKSGVLKTVSAPTNTMLYFDWQTWHQGTKAVKNGWRWFMRASRNTQRPIKNEIRRQVQVYLEKPMEGW